MLEMNEDKTVLLVEGLSKRIGSFSVTDVGFQVKQGYITGFIGRNGAGKTTVMKLILNRLIKDGGSVIVAGFDNGKQERDAKNRIGYVGEEHFFLKNTSLYENGMLYGRLYDRFCIDDFLDYLKKFKLSSGLKYGELSKGMETKAQLAFALSYSPRLLMLDEPTGGLDPVFRREFLSLLQELLEKMNMGVLFSTHITSDLDKVADYIMMIEEGKLLFSRNREELLEGFSEHGQGKIEDIMYQVLKGKVSV